MVSGDPGKIQKQTNNPMDDRVDRKDLFICVTKEREREKQREFVCECVCERERERERQREYIGGQ